MINTIKQNKKAVLAFLLALVMLIGLIPFTATEAYAMTIDATSGYITWENGDSFTLVLVSKNDPNKTETHKVTYDGANWSEIKSSILPAHAFAYIGDVNGIEYVNEQWNYDPVLWLDQRTADKFSAADVMIATGEATKEYSLALKFEHLYTKVTFNIEYASEFADTDKDTALTVSGGYIDVKAFVGETTAEVIIPPRTYTAGELFATVTVNGDTTLKVKAPEGFTFEAGTNYTFDLKVGKNKVEIETVTVNGNFPGGWENDNNYGKDWALNDDGGNEDPGKTAWEIGDETLVHLYSQEYGDQAVTMTYENGEWQSDGGTLSHLKDETATITAVYAPDYEIKSDGSIGLKEGKLPGMAEYILAKTTISGNTLDIRFEDGRTYSRLRIATMPGAEITVKTTGFTPAGPNGTTAPESYTLTADANGNAYLYGTFAKNGTVAATAKHEIYPTNGITTTSRANYFDDEPSENGQGYVLAVKLGDKMDKSLALSGDIALSDGSFVSESMIGSMTDAQKAAAVGIVFWTVVDTDPTGRTYPATLTDDKVMNADFPQCTHGLIVSFKNLEMAWQGTSTVYENVYEAFQNTDLFDPSNIAKSEYASVECILQNNPATLYQILGYNNTKVLEAYNQYCKDNDRQDYIIKPVDSITQFTAENPEPFGSTGWYLPSAKELHMLCYKDVDDVKGAQGIENKLRINEILSSLSGDTLGDVNYWTSESYFQQALNVSFANSKVSNSDKMAANYVRFICAF